MYTANTMAAVAEALGMSLPGSAAPPAVDRRRDGFAHRSGEAVVEMLRQGITARQIMTKEAFENAIAVVMALGGSTNAVLHLLAIAREAEVDLTLDDFNRIGDKVPHLGDLKPFGRYVMNDVDKIGGIPVVMKALLDAGLMHGDCLTVTGRTMAENLAEHRPARRRRRRSSASWPSRSTRTGGLTILQGLAGPRGRGGEVGRLRRRRSSRAPPGSSTASAPRWTRSRPAQIVAGDVVVIRYEGPKGGPGMREMLAITGAIKGAGLGKDVLLITDGRFSGGTTGPVRRPHRPEAVDGGPIAFVRDGDRITPRRGQPAARRRASTTTSSPPARDGWTPQRAEVHPRRARQVRQGRAVRRARRRLRLSPASREAAVADADDGPTSRRARRSSRTLSARADRTCVVAMLSSRTRSRRAG